MANGADMASFLLMIDINQHKRNTTPTSFFSCANVTTIPNKGE